MTPLPIRRCAANLLIGGFAWIAACSDSDEPKGYERPPLDAPSAIIFVSLDTLRADYLGLYDYAKYETSPFLDSFAKESVVFENSVVVEPWTLTSHMSLMTGLHPHHHGVDKEVNLAEGIETLAMGLSKGGYATAAFADGGWMRNKWGLNRGFDVYRSGKRRGFREILGEARRWLDGNSNEKFFLFLHTYDVHGNGMKPFYRTEPPMRGAFSANSESEFANCNKKTFERLFTEREDRLTDADVEFIRARYAEGVRYVDSELRGFVDYLRERGIYDRALIVIWSDHGEGLADHGIWGHKEIYDQTIRSPLIMKVPGIEGRRVRSVVSAVDIAPTLLDLAHLPVPASIDGRSFARYLFDDPVEGAAFSVQTGHGRPEHLENPDLPWFSIRTPTHHLIHDSTTGRFLFYDVEADPEEHDDLAGNGGSVEVEMRARLAEWMAEYETGHIAVSEDDLILDDDVTRELEALGYVGDE